MFTCKLTTLIVSTNRYWLLQLDILKYFYNLQQSVMETFKTYIQNLGNIQKIHTPPLQVLQNYIPKNHIHK
jgi:hypothetical protein